MKNIENYVAEKYHKVPYKQVEEGIYKITDNFTYEDVYITSLSFVQEPELNEGDNSSDISQYPLEDILDKFLVSVSDFYDNLNDGTSNVCYQEFASSNIDDIRALRNIIGKHVYNEEETDNLIIE